MALMQLFTMERAENDWQRDKDSSLMSCWADCDIYHVTHVLNLYLKLKLTEVWPRLLETARRVIKAVLIFFV